MHEEESPVVPFKMINIPHLRERALLGIGDKKDYPINTREDVTIANMIAQETGEPEPEILVHLMNDLESARIPRYIALVGMLAPYGLVTQYPTLIIRIARYLLGDTTVEEEERVDWEWVKKMHPELKL